MKRQLAVLMVVIVSLISVQCGGTPPATEAPPTEAPTATEVPPTEAPAATKVPATLDGQALLQERCTTCHGLGGVERAKKTEEEWKATVERMVGKGAELDEAEQELLIKYLAETYPKAAKVPPTEAPATLDGQSLLQDRCTVCHGLGGVERAKKTEEEWKATVERMVGKGAELDEAEQELLIKYLAEMYPK
jgi:mono/diheme cytochrome c family protein